MAMKSLYKVYNVPAVNYFKKLINNSGAKHKEKS
jgi:hypothetical protein